MSNKIRTGICGYGNLGRGVEYAVTTALDMTLVGVFTRRSPETVKTVTGCKVYHADDLQNMSDQIDVLILCGGSATDLPVQSPFYAKNFNIVDSFDTHARIPEHFANVNKSAEESNHVAVISAGWDPGLFSINRLYGESVLPQGESYTFWGKGVSQGHTDAIKRIDGVANAIQYTVPIEAAVNRVRSGEMPRFTDGEKHKRVCYVVAEDCADKTAIKRAIVNMPNYFAPYDTEVNFIDEDTLKREHRGMPHGGFVMRNGTSGTGTKQRYEFSLALDSNPEFTGGVLAAYGRAAYRMAEAGNFGAKTVMEIPPYLLSERTIEELRKEML